MVAEITAFLEEIDSEFDPPLSSRTNLEAYASKLTTLATILSIRETARLTAFAAIYCNDPHGTTAFLSMIAVRKDRRGRGLARVLLDMCSRYLRERHFTTLKLEVYRNNMPARQMYERLGFQVVDESESSFVLSAN